jgi:uncharacterized membrane protein
MVKRWLVWFGFSAVLGWAAPLAHAQGFAFQTFIISGIAPGPSSIGVQGLNDFGATSGSLTDTSNNGKAWVRDARGSLTVFVDPLNTSVPTFTVADHNNDLGAVVGEYYNTGQEEYLGFFYFRGNFSSYIAPGMEKGGTTSVDGINNFGSFCGYTANPPFTQWNAFVVIGGNTKIFTVNGSTDAFCQGINDEGFAVGAYYDSAGVLHGWVRNPWTGEVKTIDAPWASTVVGLVPCTGNIYAAGTAVYGINDAGEMVGHYWDTANFEHGFVLLPNGKFKKIDVPGATLTSGGAVNNLGQVAGHYVDSSCDSFGYIGTPNRDDDED